MTDPEQLAPDDDPRFTAWLNDIGPMRDMPPDVEVGKPVVVALAVLIGASALVVALGWVAVFYAVRAGVPVSPVLALMVLGTVLVLMGSAGAYYFTRDRS